MKKTENEAMMWTSTRKENETLRNEILKTQKTHKKAINDISVKGSEMEQLMRQLLDERSRLVEELSQTRKYRDVQVKETNSKTTMTVSFPRKDGIVQVNLQRDT
ncbi:hypothetical protein LSM04_006520 [Trypanosoma melophagium]|uniref:uncharacterized protein n=1 Tax=Trypanosoma melophagium TaxID=715481 RepID=UPI00351A2D77|nr:hypothetical protein LSM04_006520 [Trypanosoma melophagium]